MQAGVEGCFPMACSASTLYLEEWSGTLRGESVPAITKVFNSATPGAFSEVYLHEAAAKASPGVVKVYDRGLSRGRLLLKLEYCANGALAWDIERRKQKNSPYEPAFLLTTMISMLRTLRDVHAANIAHRGVTSDNFLLTADNSVKLTDFGNAKLIKAEREFDLHTEEPGMNSRNKAFLSPYAEDVYNLGKIVYEMATFRPCRYGQIPNDLLRASIRGKLSDYCAITETLSEMLIWPNEERVTAAEALMQLERLPDLSEDTPIMYVTTTTEQSSSGTVLWDPKET